MENNIKNYVITISGEPGSGKSTIVKSLSEKYTKLGKIVHIISVGKIFREIAIEEYKRRFPDVKNPTIEDVNNDIRFKKYLENIDTRIDAQIAKKGKEINSVSRHNEVYIIDSRLAWKTVDNAFDVRLTVDDEEAGKRVFFDKTRGKEDRYESLDEAIKTTKRRKEGEVKRFGESYGDITSPENYNIIIDTSHATVNDISDEIMKALESYLIGQPYPKYYQNSKIRGKEWNTK